MTDTTQTQTITISTDQVLAKFIQKIISGMDATVEFASAQLPDIINQLLWWKAVESFIPFIISFVVSIIWLRKIRKDVLIKPEPGKFNTVYDTNGDVWPICLFHVSILIPVIVVCDAWDWLKIIIAPKIYLIEYASNLIK